MNQYVIIGAGAAGVAAAEAIRGQDSSGKITLLSEEAPGYYSRPGLAFYLTGELPESQLFPFTSQDFLRLGVQPLHAQAVRIHPQAHRIELHNGKLLAYDRLLIATGSAASPMKAPGSQAQGVVKLDSLEDARQILRLARKQREAVVVGGGITALEIVEGLVAQGVKVHYFLRGDRYWSNVLDETESRIVEHRLKEDKVQLHYQTELEEILTKDGHVIGVRTRDGRQIRCGIVAVAIGVQPRKELGVASGLQAERGLVVDQYLCTSASDIFAAGDVAQMVDGMTGKAILSTLWALARDQGTVAGLNMVGSTTKYSPPVPFNVTRLACLTTTIIGKVGSGEDLDLQGIARGDSETWRQLPDAIAAQAVFDVNRLRLLIVENRLIGAIVMGNQTLSQPLQHLIRNKANISSIRDRILKPGAQVADILAGFWTEYRTDASCATQQSRAMAG
jgi:NAD(P)H-nitrite reductase large subunit